MPQRLSGLRQVGLRQVGDAAGLSSQALPSQGIRLVLEAQASAVCGFGFNSWQIEAINASEGLSSPGFVGLTQTPLLTGPAGRSGLGKVNYTMAGAGGVAVFRPSIPFGVTGSALTAFVANASLDNWYLSARAAIPVTCATGEIALGGMSIGGTINASDASTTAYIYFGVTGATSTSHLVIKTLDNSQTALVTDTGFTFDPTVGGWHEYTLFLWYGTLYVQVDFTTVFTLPMGQAFANFPDLANAVPVYFFRTTAAASQTCYFDRLWAAGPQ